MKVGTVRLSELGDRWDAGFHLTNQQYKSQAAAIEQTISKAQALEILDEMPAEVLRLISNLCRGTGVAAKPTHDSLVRAAHEYPFLALAIIKEEGRDALERRRAEAISAAEKISSLIDGKIGMIEKALVTLDTKDTKDGENPCDLTPPVDWLTKIDSCTESAIQSNNFVAGVVYFDGSEYSIPVETSPKAYVADCWVIEAENFTQNAIQNLFLEGNVPVPRRPEDLGRPVGFLDGLPDHTKNYGMGWRR